MSVTLKLQQLKEEESDISIDQHDDDDANELTDDEQKETKSNLDLNYLLKNRLDKKKVQVKEVQSTIIMPQDLRKSDNILKLNEQTEECDVDTTLLEKSPKSSSLSSWKHYDGRLDDDVYTITAADQSLPSSSLQITSIDGFFNRKRGRPPKNRFVEVYKNTQQKPQAIFTSFKLEKQGLTETASIYDDCLTNCDAQSSVETSKVCDSDNNYSTINFGHKPRNENSTRFKRSNRVNTIISTQGVNNRHSHNPATMIDDEESKINYFSNTKRCSLVSYDDDGTKPTTVARGLDNESSISLAFGSGPEFKKLKLCGTVDNVTVIRAAGTFYPENCRENPCNNFKEKPADIIKEKQATLTLSDNEVAQNLSLKDRTLITATDGLESTNSNYSINADCSSVLPQIYNVLQMQQQLFAFYQQIALMTPAFSQLASNSGQATALKESSCSQLSFTATAGTENLLNNKHLINVILNLQKQQATSNSTGEELTIDTKVVDNSRSQKITKSFDISSTPEQNLPERQLQFGREGTPSGYLRFRFNEDCGYENCGYRQHQSHFHCNRADCQYSFCDKTRFVQHTARHERLDTLMGTDFQQYRATMTCNYAHCPYAFNQADDLNDIINNRKSSHFHCLKCPFVCADTNKVVAHRRLHSKMEFIRLAGFRKVTTKENCMIAANFLNDPLMPHCPYTLRHAHYHCLVCNCSVLSRSQLFGHKHRETVTSTSSSTPQQQPLIRDKTSPENHRVCKESTL